MSKPAIIDIYVWQPDLSNCHFQATPHYSSSLSISEKIILNNISSKRRKEEYLAGHYFVKKIAANYYPYPLEVVHKKDCPPYFLTNTQNTNNLDSTDNKKPPLFNLSHSGNTITCCISESLQVGIDIEQQKTRKNLLAIAKNYFTKEEYQQLTKLSAKEQEQYFYCLWTLKESYLKAQRHNNHSKMLKTTFSKQAQNTDIQCYHTEILDRLHLSLSISSREAIKTRVYLSTEHTNHILNIQWQDFYPISN